jgi:hypothetical protein
VIVISCEFSESASGFAPGVMEVSAQTCDNDR